MFKEKILLHDDTGDYYPRRVTWFDGIPTVKHVDSYILLHKDGSTSKKYYRWMLVSNLGKVARWKSTSVRA